MTNYSLFELTSKMDHEERMRTAAKFRLQAELLPKQAEILGLRLLATLMQFVKSWLSIQNQTVSVSTNNSVAKNYQAQERPSEPSTLPVTSESFFHSLRAKTSINEEEWQLLVRMVHNKRISLEQAEQLVGVLNG